MMNKPAIVCVDDEMIVLRSMKSQIKEHYGKNFVYEIAEDGNEAMEIIDELFTLKYTPLIMITDWLMPNMKGDELVIKVHKKYKEVVTIIVTGQADENAVKRAQDHGNLHKVLYKPWRIESLINAIDSGLKQKN
jgi:YesN/AraC family two-component response regulator